MSSTMKNIVVIGGSYVGCKLVDFLAPLVHQTHQVILIEKNSHFQHLFAFPRISIVPGIEERAFIPYKDAFHACPEGSTKIIHGIVTEIQQDQVVIDGGRIIIPYEYLAIATGTTLPAPGTIPCTDKARGQTWFQSYQARVHEAKSIIAIGGGAIGVQMVTDIADHFGKGVKKVTLIHSRPHLVNRFDPKLHDIVMKRMDELGIEVILSSRVRSWGENEVVLEDGRRLEADLVIPCTGSSPRSDLIRAFAPGTINPKTGEIDVLDTMQIAAWTESFELDDDDVDSDLSSGDASPTNSSSRSSASFCCNGPGSNGVCCKGPVRQEDGATDFLRNHNLIRADELSALSEAKDLLTPTPDSTPPTPRRVTSRSVWRVDGEALVSAVTSLALRSRLPNRASPLALATATATSDGISIRMRRKRLTYPNIFALGDVCRLPIPGGAHKAARPGAEQAGVAARNIARMIKAESCEISMKPELESYKDKPAGIRLSLGLRFKVLFRNPIVEGGEPLECECGENGMIDVSCGMMWRLRAPGVTDYSL